MEEGGQPVVELQEDLIRYLPYPTALLDEDGTVLQLSDSFRALFLHPDESVTTVAALSRALGPFTGPQGRSLPETRQPWHRALRGEEFSDERLLLLAGPGLGRALLRFSSRRLPGGRMLLSAVELGQVSEREELLRRIVDEFPAPFTLIRHADRKVIEVNDELAMLIGYRRDELLGLKVDASNVQVKFTEFEQITQAAVTQGETQVTMQRSGTERPLHLLTWCRHFELDGEQYNLAIFVDITRFKEIETDLKEATESVLRTATEFSRGIVQQLERLQSKPAGPQPDPAVRLTRRELDVMGRVGAGYTNQRIAQELELTPQTVRNYVTRIYRKVGVTNRAEAIVWARERGLVNG